MITRYNIGGEGTHRFQTSEARNFLIFKEGTRTITKPLGTDSVSFTIKHNLGYVPATLVYCSLGGTSLTTYLPAYTDLIGEGNYTLVPFSQTIFNFPNPQVYELVTANVDKYQITITYFLGDPTGVLTSVARTATFKYLIFREKAN